jgi:hypothetical protein
MFQRNNLSHLPFFALVALLFLLSCEASKEADIDLGPLPNPPNIDIEVDPNNANRIIVKNTSQDYFSHLWIAPGASPETSTKAIDTFFFPRAGEYTITLHVASRTGSGTSQNTRTIVIEQDGTVACEGGVAILTGGCLPKGKCWRFSSEAGAITVGPTYGSGAWYASPPNGLVPEQVSARWCFEFDAFAFVFKNNGITISPWDGYVGIPHDPTQGPWEYRVGTGQNGVDQVVLTSGQFMGTWDSGNVLDIVQLTEERLVVRTRLVNRQGTPQSEGWFEFRFVAE